MKSSYMWFIVNDGRIMTYTPYNYKKDAILFFEKHTRKTWDHLKKKGYDVVKCLVKPCK